MRSWRKNDEKEKVKADISTWDLLKEVDKLCCDIPGWRVVNWDDMKRSQAVWLASAKHNQAHNKRLAAEKRRNVKRFDIKRR